MDYENKAEKTRYSVPICTISENEGVVTAKLEMPGVAREGLEVRIAGNELSIIGRRDDPQEEGVFLMRERRVLPYRKLFTIDETVSRDDIEASLVNGILTLELHLKEAAKPRRIDIS